MAKKEEAAFLKWESREASRLVSRVRSERPNLAGFLASLDEKVCGRPLVEACVALGQEYRFCEPGIMLQAAFAANVAAGNLDLRRYSSPMIADLRARTFAELGNAYRVNEDFEAAEQALAKAYAHLGQGTGDPYLLACILSLEASLWSSQRRHSEAIEQFAGVQRLYECLGESRLVGRALIQKGRNIGYAGRTEEAVSTIRDGLSRLDTNLDWQFTPHARFSLITSLVDSRDYRRARRLVLESGLRKAFSAEPLNLLRVSWTEGSIHAGLGRLARAEGIFLDAKAAFSRRKLNLEGALVGLELAGVWRRQGRRAEARTVASQAFKTFKRLKVEREALRAAHFLSA